MIGPGGQLFFGPKFLDYIDIIAIPLKAHKFGHPGFFGGIIPGSTDIVLPVPDNGLNFILATNFQTNVNGILRMNTDTVFILVLLGKNLILGVSKSLDNDLPLQLLHTLFSALRQLVSVVGNH